VSEYNHSAHVMETILWNYFDETELPSDMSVGREEMLEKGMSEEEISLIEGEGDPREFAMKNWGWKRVAGTNVQTYFLTNKDLSTIADGLWSCYEDWTEEGNFTIEVLSNNKIFHNIPYDVIGKNNVMSIVKYRNFNELV